MKAKHIYIFLFIASIIIACNSDKSPLAKYGKVFEGVMRSEQGVFRGFSLGDKLEDIQKGEELAMEADEGYLYYEYSVDTTATYSVAYTFDEGRLDEIQSYIFVNDNTKTEETFNTFKNYFNQHYGESQDHMGFWVWTVKSEKYGIVRINLSDESADFSVANAPGKISIWIYPEKAE
jgi:hypothetical protein